MSERIKQKQNNSNCGNEGKKCPTPPIFSKTSYSLNQSNALRLAKLIINNRKKPQIVYVDVNSLGGSSGSLGGARALPKNKLV